MSFPKLVRDKMVEVLRARGETVEFTRWAASTKMDHLAEKLREEAQEFSDDRNIEELADVVEVINGIIAAHPHWTWEDVKKVADGKRIARGGFTQGIILTDPVPKYEERKLKIDTFKAPIKVTHTEACVPGRTDPDCPLPPYRHCCCCGGPIDRECSECQ